MSEFKKLLTTLEDQTCLLAQILNELSVLKEDIEALRNRPIYVTNTPYVPQPPYVVPTVWPKRPTTGDPMPFSDPTWVCEKENYVDHGQGVTVRM